MFVSNVHGTESIQALAARVGCVSGEAMRGRGGYGRPGLIGNTYGIKDALKAAGARFDGENKAWVFESRAGLEAALQSIVK